MKQNLLLVVLVLVTIFGGWVLWVRTHPTDDSFIEQVKKPGVEDIGVVLEPNVDLVQDTEVPPSVDGPNNKRIVHVPDNRQDSEPSKRDIDPEFRRSIEAKIETALAGNIEDTITVARELNVCDRAPFSELLITTQAKFYLENPQVERTIPDENGWFAEAVTFNEWEAYQWKQFNQCQSIIGIFEEDLRSRIKIQAKNGHVIARYIYAMWSPSRWLPTRINAIPGIIFERLDYESLALEFTWLNIDEGEPLGLFALGQSYLRIAHFTPFHMATGYAFLSAARTCGLSNTWVDSMIDNLGDSSEQIQAVSSEIVETFCN